jgi:hypothetical protein
VSWLTFGVVGLLALAGMSWLFGQPVLAIVCLGFAIALAIPAARWGRQDQYPFSRSAFYSREARLRRAQLTVSVSKLKMREPFYRLLSILGWLLFATHIAFALYMLLAAFLWTDLEIVDRVWLYYFAIIFLVAAILAVIGLHKWVKRHEPETIKLQVGNSPLLVSDFVPGTYTDTVDLLEKNTESGGAREAVHVELIPWGTVKNVSRVVAPIRGVIVARRLNWIDALSEKADRADSVKVDPPPRFAGRLMGMFYKIPCKPEPYMMGDLGNWRQYDWAGLVNKHFRGETHDFMPILLALDPFNPYTWEAPPEQPTIVRELYEARARVKQLTRRHQDYVQQDSVTESFQEGARP